ncbi:MAG: Crp/Fnr family transcriptional regulator [Kofleriaceae bacterium]
MAPTAPDPQQMLTLVLGGIASTDERPPPEQLVKFVSMFHPKKLESGDMYRHSGELAPSLDFVVSGFLRLAYLREDGREFTKGFVRPGVFHAVLDTVLGGVPSRYFAQAATPVRMLVADYNAIAAFFETHVFWHRLSRRLFERLALHKQRREASLLMDSAAARYEDFLSEYADLEPQITDQMIASYLGVTAETLSRIKRERSLGTGRT